MPIWGGRTLHDIPFVRVMLAGESILLVKERSKQGWLKGP
jgi:hypothetical protein